MHFNIFTTFAKKGQPDPAAMMLMAAMIKIVHDNLSIGHDYLIYSAPTVGHDHGCGDRAPIVGAKGAANQAQRCAAWPTTTAQRTCAPHSHQTSLIKDYSTAPAPPPLCTHARRAYVPRTYAPRVMD